MLREELRARGPGGEWLVLPLTRAGVPLQLCSDYALAFVPLHLLSTCCVPGSPDSRACGDFHVLH